MFMETILAMHDTRRTNNNVWNRLLQGYEISEEVVEVVKHLNGYLMLWLMISNVIAVWVQLWLEGHKLAKLQHVLAIASVQRKHN